MAARTATSSAGELLPRGTVAAFWRRFGSVIPPTVIACAFSLAAWPAQDWDIFQAAARLGLKAYEYDNGYTGPLTGPITILAASVLPYSAAVVITLALFPFALWREPTYQVARLWLGIAIAPIWGGLAAWGHLDDAGAAVLLLEARRTAGWRRGLLVGLAIACKPWAIIGIAFCLPDRMTTAIAGAVQVVWLPFLPAAATMEKDTVTVRYGSPLRAVFDVEALPPSWLRPAELLLLILVAWGLRYLRREDAVLAGALAVKMVLDPGDFDYYWGAWAIALLPMRHSSVIAMTAVAASWLVILPHLYDPTGAATTMLAATAVLATCLMPRTAASRALRGLWPLRLGLAGMFVLASAWEVSVLY